MQVTAAITPTESLTAAAAAARRELPPIVPTPAEQDAAIQTQEKHRPIVVGVTPTCPYGLSACWGGAYEALSRLHGVRLVRPVPNAEDSTAYVYLHHDGLPDIDGWPAQFAKVANGSHLFRGVEVTVEGVVESHPLGVLVMRGSDKRSPLLLEPLAASAKIQWDSARASIKPLEPEEEQAYPTLLARVKAAGGSLIGTITGPLDKSANDYIVQVRQFSAS